MPTGTVTITGTLGPGQSVTSLAFDNVSSINFDLARSVISITANNKTTDFSYNDIDTVTYTISGTTATITIS